MSTNNTCDYTPGPWHCEYFPNLLRHWDVSYGPADDAAERFSVLEDLSKANAQLIAAAPELLKACQLCIEDSQCSQRCDGPHQGCPCWYCRTCAAIAKGTGGQP